MQAGIRLAAIGYVMGMIQIVSATAATPPKASGIDAIWAYAGTWKMEMEHFDTANSKAGHETTSLRNDCWKSGGYVACNQYVDGDSKTLLVFTYDAKRNIYTSYPIPPDGGAAGSGTLLIEGNTWTFPWQISEGEKTTYFRVVNVWTSPSTIEFRQEFSTDNAHWTLMAKGMESKLKTNAQ